MEHDLRLTIFWVVHLALLGVFVVEHDSIVPRRDTISKEIIG